MPKKKSSSLITISIITVITLFIWIGVEGFQRFTKKDLKTVPAEILNPLTPTLDKAVFETIKSKKMLSPQEAASLKPRHLKESSRAEPESDLPVQSQEETVPESIATDSAVTQP